MANDRNARLHGRWRRATEPPPAADPEAVPLGQDASQLPAEIEFHGGVYRAYKGPDQMFIAWDAGTFDLGEDELAISLANDAIATYPLELTDDSFTVVDACGHETTYRRAI